MNLLLTSEPIVRRSDTGALAVEIAWLRAAELPKLTRVEELLAGHDARPRPRGPPPRPGPLRLRRPLLHGAAPPSRPPGRRAAAAAATAQPAPAPKPAETAPPRGGAAAAAASAPAPPPSRPGDPITAFKEEAGKRKQNIGGFLDARARTSASRTAG